LILPLILILYCSNLSQIHVKAGSGNRTRIISLEG
jgi:hypothetical protein